MTTGIVGVGAYAPLLALAAPTIGTETSRISMPIASKLRSRLFIAALLWKLFTEEKKYRGHAIDRARRDALSWA